MTQTLTQTQPETGLLNLNMVSWRIHRSRAQDRKAQVHRQLLARLHDDKNLN